MAAGQSNSPRKQRENHTALQSRIMIMKTQAKAPRENFSILMPWQRLEERAGIALNPLDPIPRSEAYEPPDMANLVIAEAHPARSTRPGSNQVKQRGTIGIQRSYEMAEIRRLLPQETGRQRSRTSTDSRVRLSIERGIPLGLHAGEFHGSRFGLRERTTKRFGNR